MRISAYDPHERSQPPLHAAGAEADRIRARDATRLHGYEAGATLLRALASPVRLALIDELSTGEHCVHELMDAVKLPQTQVSQHLRVLKDARLVTSHRRAREVVYSLLDEHAARIVWAVLVHGRRSR